jgi:hypothetical protein
MVAELWPRDDNSQHTPGQMINQLYQFSWNNQDGMDRINNGYRLEGAVSPSGPSGPSCTKVRRFLQFIRLIKRQDACSRPGSSNPPPPENGGSPPGGRPAGPPPPPPGSPAPAPAPRPSDDAKCIKLEVPPYFDCVSAPPTPTSSREPKHVPVVLTPIDPKPTPNCGPLPVPPYFDCARQ